MQKWLYVNFTQIYAEDEIQRRQFQRSHYTVQNCILKKTPVFPFPRFSSNVFIYNFFSRAFMQIRPK